MVAAKRRALQRALFGSPRAPSGAGGQGPRLPPGELQRRNNFGFQQVEILPGNIGYVRLGQFPDIAFDDPKDPAREQADAALTLTRNADALIIDLRNSPGGRPAMVGYLISALVENATPIYNVFHWRDGDSVEAPDVPYAHPRPNQPVYLLTSGRTASAAEGFSYTLQAAKRAIVIGESTAGGANPGGFVDVGGGFAVFVSSGSPVNPITGGNWEGTGVLPDVRVAAGDALVAAEKLALQDALKRETASSPRLDQRWALQALEPEKRLPGDVLHRYVGSYQGLDVRLEHDRLRAQRKGRPPYELQAITESEFAVVDDPGLHVVFVMDADSRVAAAELVTSAGPRMRFARGE